MRKRSVVRSMIVAFAAAAALALASCASAPAPAATSLDLRSVSVGLIPIQLVLSTGQLMGLYDNRSAAQQARVRDLGIREDDRGASLRAFANSQEPPGDQP